MLNVANARSENISHNQQIINLMQELGCETRSRYQEKELRYDKVIIMTDSDVNGAHRDSLLLNFSHQEW
ncbi:hypothetical protein H0G72_04510 [Liberibacter sp. Z1]|nr:hypothetical protein [Candidatus Liberibacter sp.]